eukprot:7194102-Prymnesium_polylepis.1
MAKEGVEGSWFQDQRGRRLASGERRATRPQRRGPEEDGPPLLRHGPRPDPVVAQACARLLPRDHLLRAHRGGRGRHGHVQ